ncbi:unnamed protein product [Ostreobium quekettii]|uniref:Transmembrane protein n=1 Tax=Ostreobium quekettii TaxID=121088 RepID=A0A8S1IPP4_9CHLO|nr:unnamed protein product [Ostreobium quekettii]|eukprot:evm.model.scf_614.3 EVM.evm.TU.scf_614.3   scf_614:9375-10466(+)
MRPSQSADLMVFWAFSAFASAALGVLELVGQARALSAVEALCSLAQCGSLAVLTAWIVRGQMLVCAAAVAYVLSCVALLNCPVVGYRLAVGLLLALVVCTFHLVAAIGQFTNGGWIVGGGGEALEVERGEVVFGLCWCLTVVFVLMVLLLCADHAQHVASNLTAHPRYLSQATMAQIEAQRPRKHRSRGNRDARTMKSWHSARRDLYPILEADEEEAAEEQCGSGDLPDVWKGFEGSTCRI